MSLPGPAGPLTDPPPPLCCQERRLARWHEKKTQWHLDFPGKPFPKSIRKPKPGQPYRRRNSTPKGPRTWPGKKARAKARRLREAAEGGDASALAQGSGAGSGAASRTYKPFRADITHLQSRGKSGRGRAQKPGKKRLAKLKKAARARTAPQNKIH